MRSLQEFINGNWFEHLPPYFLSTKSLLPSRIRFVQDFNSLYRNPPEILSKLQKVILRVFSVRN